jgi:hypothetical protein
MKCAEAMMQCFTSQRARDELAVLKYAMSTDFDDGLDGLSEIGSAAVPSLTATNANAAPSAPNPVHDELPYIRWVAPRTASVLQD